MDCEKFESAMMDDLYGELDEVSSAAAKKHVAGCAKCASLAGGLRTTRRMAVVPTLEPPADLQDRIVAAAKDAQKVVRVRGGQPKVARAISIAGRWAMQPQTAVAAVFLVMIGTSVLLLRGKASRAPSSADVIVTEQGVPSPAACATAPVVAAEPRGAGASTAAYASPPRPAEAKPNAPSTPAADLPEVARERAPFAPASSPMAGGGAGARQQEGEPQSRRATTPFESAMQAYLAGRYDEAMKEFDALAPGDPASALMAARAAREGKSCRGAIARFDAVAQRAAQTSAGWDALLEGALCYRAIGDFGNARVRLQALLKVDAYKDRAQAEIDRLGPMQAPAVPKKPAAAATDSAY